MLYPVMPVKEQLQEGKIRSYPEATGRPKTRMLVKKGSGFALLKLEEIVLFHTVQRVVYAMDKNGKKYTCNDGLRTIITQLDPATFFRVNRQYILNIDFIQGYSPFERVKVRVFIDVAQLSDEIIISQEKAPMFREWIKNA